MTNAYTKEAMRARFWVLQDKKAALNKELAEPRAKRDAMRDALRKPLAEFKALGRAVAAVERPRMGEIDTEMAVLARALGNKVGERPS